jgi:hypothetical protein
MGRLLFWQQSRIRSRMVAALLARDPRHELAKQRAVLEVLSQAGVRGGDPVERQHLLDGVGVAEEHHDFLQVRAAHHTPL